MNDREGEVDLVIDFVLLHGFFCFSLAALIIFCSVLLVSVALSVLI